MLPQDYPLLRNRNLLANPNFAVCQRRATGVYKVISAGQYDYPADRWKAYRGGLVAGLSIANLTDFAGFANAVLLSRTLGDTSLQYMGIVQELETIDSKPLQGEYLTFTAQVYPGAGAAGTISLLIIGSTGTDQGYLGGLTGNTTLATSTFPVVAGRISVTTDNPVPSTITQITVIVSYTPSTATAVANDNIAVVATKLEVGKQFTGWDFPNYAENLARCLRYCYVMPYGGEDQYFAVRYSSTLVRQHVPFPVRMRASPTFSHNVTGWNSVTLGTTEIGTVDQTGPAWTTISGALTLTISSSYWGSLISYTAGTSFSGTTGSSVIVYAGSGVYRIVNAEL